MKKCNSPYNQDALMNLLENQQLFSDLCKQLCEKALTDAKNQLHPLLRQVELERLGQRKIFVDAFKCALETEITRRVILLLPCVQAVYRFDTQRGSNAYDWDNKIHLLLLVPQLMASIKDLNSKLDTQMLRQLQRPDWKRFWSSTTFVEVQQVTRDEVRHGVCYGAMFASYYAGPLQIWPVTQSVIPTFTFRQPSFQSPTGFNKNIILQNSKS